MPTEREQSLDCSTMTAGDSNASFCREPDACCPVCSGSVAFFAEGVVLRHHVVMYLRCRRCGLIFLPRPHWLEEAYASPIARSDTGLLRRCRTLSHLTSGVIRSERLKHGRFLDWAGGYGTLTQLMRDRGYDYWHHDDYTSAIFARDFIDDASGRYDLVTAFEVVEHLADPAHELADISRRTDLLLFSTMLLPEPPPIIGEWWYYGADAGQHVTFHTLESLQVLGARLGFRLTSNGRNWHLFHRQPVRRLTKLVLSPKTPRFAEAVRGMATPRNR